jgi:hypothetical protein
MRLHFIIAIEDARSLETMRKKVKQAPCGRNAVEKKCIVQFTDAGEKLRSVRLVCHVRCAARAEPGAKELLGR